MGLEPEGSPLSDRGLVGGREETEDGALCGDTSGYRDSTVASCWGTLHTFSSFFCPALIAISLHLYSSVLLFCHVAQTEIFIGRCKVALQRCDLCAKQQGAAHTFGACECIGIGKFHDVHLGPKKVRNNVLENSVVMFTIARS